MDTRRITINRKPFDVSGATISRETVLRLDRGHLGDTSGFYIFLRRLGSRESVDMTKDVRVQDGMIFLVSEKRAAK